jgi:hypothetical protein
MDEEKERQMEKALKNKEQLVSRNRQRLMYALKQIEETPCIAHSSSCNAILYTSVDRRKRKYWFGQDDGMKNRGEEVNSKMTLVSKETR